jgi:hypothetical protein
MLRIQSHLSESLNVKNGLRQSDALACLLFNIALEKVVHESNIQTRGTIFLKTTQILAYADDIDIMSCTMMGLNESFISFEKSACQMGLVINQEKTVYMYSGRKENSLELLSLGEYVFCRVDNFNYLGSNINRENSRMVEMKRCLTMADRSYYGLMKHLNSKTLSRNMKVTIYKTLMRPVLIYGAEAWVLTKQDEMQLGCFERKILCKIYGLSHFQGE